MWQLLAMCGVQGLHIVWKGWEFGDILQGVKGPKLLFPTFWGSSYFFLLLGKIPELKRYFFRFLLKSSDW